jgi:hypothetical protein
VGHVNIIISFYVLLLKLSFFGLILDATCFLLREHRRRHLSHIISKMRLKDKTYGLNFLVAL